MAFVVVVVTAGICDDQHIPSEDFELRLGPIIKLLPLERELLFLLSFYNDLLLVIFNSQTDSMKTAIYMELLFVPNCHYYVF